MPSYKRRQIGVDYVRNKLESRGQYGAADVLNTCHDLANKGSRVGKEGVQMLVNAFQYHPISVHYASEFGLTVNLRKLEEDAKHSQSIYVEAVCYNFLPEERSKDTLRKFPLTEVLAQLQLLGRGVHTLDIVDMTHLFPQQVIGTLNVLRLNEGFFYKGKHIKADCIADVFGHYSSFPGLYGNRPLRTVRFDEKMMEWGRENRLGLKVAELSALNLAKIKMKNGEMEIFPPNPNYDLEKRDTATLSDKKFVISDRSMMEMTKSNKRLVKADELVKDVCELREDMVRNLLKRLNPQLMQIREQMAEPVFPEKYRTQLQDAVSAQKRRFERSKSYRRRMLVDPEDALFELGL